MKLEEIIIKSFKEGITDPLIIAQTYNLNYRSVRTIISLMRKEGRLPPKQKREKPSFFQNNS